ncbi:hypothetical protein C8J56DRAFT_1156822 [Mycena floridula]|nr:hypothetical protein C8J56DRAFT_1156822 [Mycena floridula]
MAQPTLFISKINQYVAEEQWDLLVTLPWTWITFVWWLFLPPGLKIMTGSTDCIVFDESQNYIGDTEFWCKVFEHPDIICQGN